MLADPLQVPRILSHPTASQFNAYRPRRNGKPAVRLAEAKELLDERFLLLYSDNLAPLSPGALWQRHQALGRAGDRYPGREGQGEHPPRAGDSSIDAYDATRASAGLTHVEIGYMIVERDAVMNMDPGRGSFSLVLRELAAANRLGAYEPGCGRYHSISDLGRLAAVGGLSSPAAPVLLDRDGADQPQGGPRRIYLAEGRFRLDPGDRRGPGMPGPRRF